MSVHPTPSPLDRDPRLRQDPLSAPEGYFDALSDRVLSRTAAEPRAAVSPRLRAFVFRVPVAYFESLPQRVMARLPQHAPSTIRLWLDDLADSLVSTQALRLAPAVAGIALVVAVGYFGFFRSPKPVEPTTDFFSQVALEFHSPADERLLIEALTGSSATSFSLPLDDADAAAAEEFLIQSGDVAIESL
jgi:hypothetical protein